MPGIPTGIIDTILHPPFGALTNVLDANSPYGPGDHTLTTWQDGGTTRDVSDTYGVLVIVSGLIPPKLGVVPGALLGGGTPFSGERYFDRIAQLVIQHQLLLGLGGFVTTQIEDFHMLGNLALWQEALPGRIGLFVHPLLSVNLQFLRAL